MAASSSLLSILLSTTWQVCFRIPFQVAYAFVNFYLLGGNKTVSSRGERFAELRDKWVKKIAKECKDKVEAKMVHLPRGNVTLACVYAGPPDGELMVFTHGFPDCFLTWRHQIPYFANRGFRVLSYDCRGYGDSSIPEEVPSYLIQVTAADIDELIEVSLKGTKRTQATVVGHDWGGAPTWAVAALHPHHVSRVVMINLPHPSSQAKVAATSVIGTVSQLLSSWYMFFFCIPYIPEIWLKVWCPTFYKNVFERPDVKYDDAELKELYLAYWSKEGCAEGMLRWYKMGIWHNLFKFEPKVARLPAIHQPTILLWGCQDIYLLEHNAFLIQSRVTNGSVFKFRDYGHFLHLEAPDAVNKKIEDFLTANPVK